MSGRPPGVYVRTQVMGEVLDPGVYRSYVKARGDLKEERKLMW